MKRHFNHSAGLLAMALSPVLRSVQDEEHKVREWESTIRILAGGRDGQRAIDWSKENHSGGPGRLSAYLEHTYNRLARGDELGADGAWRSRTPPIGGL